MAQGIFSPRNRQKTAEERMKELEELAKLNRGGFTAFAEDTKSNIPFMLPGQRMRPDFELNQPGLRRVAFPEPEEIPTEELTTDLPLLEMPIEETPSEPISAEDFIDYFTQQYLAPDQGIASTPDGGVLYRDGSIHYYDGTVRTGGTGDANAYPVASMPDGSVRYSDGSIRSLGLPGLLGLQEGLFGQRLDVTQDYGNINPGMGYARNIHGGIDFRTKNLSGEQRQFRMPVDTKVVEVIKAESGNPYGNSVLLQLPSGERLRFSHLSQIGDFRPGDTLRAGQVFGTPGSTGNSTAEHLDLEYYDESGRRADPRQFKGFAKVQQPQLEQSQPQGQILGTTDQQPQQTPQPHPQNAYQFTPPAELTQPKINRPMNMDFTKIQPNPQKKIGVTAANVVDVMNPTGNIDFGITEGWRGDTVGSRQKRAETIENIGTFIGAPELKTRELSQQQGTDPVRQLLGNVTDYMGNKLKQMGIDINADISEKIAGGKTTFSIPQAYAADVPAPGKGLEELKGSGQVLGAQSRPSMADISSPRVVGDVAGGDMNMRSNGSLPFGNAQIQSRMQGYDARDPFFRQGLNEKFASSINPDKAQSGTLTLDLFKDNFFNDRGNVSEAFKGTHLEQPAAQKYMESVKQNYLSKYGDSSQYDQEDVKRILASLPAASLNYTPSLPEPKRIEYPAIFSGSNQNASPSNNESKPLFQGSSYPSSSGSQPISRSSMNNLSKLAAQVKTATPSPAEQKGFQLNYAPVAASSATINKQAQQPQPSLFSTISSLLSRLFRR